MFPRKEVKHFIEEQANKSKQIYSTTTMSRNQNYENTVESPIPN